ncbi:MAG TPA: hypothetical protein VD816_13140 [Ohtaekwangia sp.]|nr:hypothetical protein [Ohtaekwangia sp.]
MSNKKPAINIFAMVCFICLTSTTLAPNFAGEINKSYKFKISKANLLREIEELNGELTTELSDRGDSLYVLRNLIVENDSIIKKVTFRIEDKNDHSVLTLKGIETFRSYPAFLSWGAKRRLQRVGEKYLIEEIK